MRPLPPRRPSPRAQRVPDLFSASTLDAGVLIAALGALAEGDFSVRLPEGTGQAGADLARAFNTLAERHRALRARYEDQEWLMKQSARLERMIRRSHDPVAAFPALAAELAPALGARYARIYRLDSEGERLELKASEGPGTAPASLALGQEMAGRCALERARIVAADGDAPAPGHVVAQPASFEGAVKAVLEVGSSQPLSAARLELLERLAEHLGASLYALEGRTRSEELLSRYQSIAAELQVQQGHLRDTNDRLEVQSDTMRRSQLLLKREQARLRAANEDLETRALALSENMRLVEQKNREVEQAKAAVEEKAEQLAMSSRYKSEFLANMSHELRTPLNSLLILARLLSENHEANLSRKQVEYARTILAAGTDLLSLINDILDLAKVESGTVTLNVASERFGDLHDYVQSTFRPMATGKGLAFDVILHPGLPETVETDSKRLRQILRNLLSNAFKFTDRGRVLLEIGPAASGWTPGHPLDNAGPVIAFAVIDTGIGIPADKHKIIFEEFQQIDGTTSRQYGGTGLGLSISRELARLLGGEIQLDSAPGKGSTFTLYLPLVHAWIRTAAASGAGGSASSPDAVPPAGSEPLSGAKPDDDRRGIEAGDRIALILESDSARGASQLAIVREAGFKGVIAADIASALALAGDVAPDLALMRLGNGAPPAGRTLDALVADPAAARVPVKMFCAAEGDDSRWLESRWSSSRPLDKPLLLEAVGRARQLAAGPVKRLLIADADAAQSGALAGMLRDEDYDVLVCERGERVPGELGGRDALLIGSQLDDMPAGELLARLLLGPEPLELPLMLYRKQGPAADRLELDRIRRAASLKQALSEILSRLQEQSREAVSGRDGAPRPSPATELKGRKALIIDDDIRNIFALTSALEHYGLRVVYAESAKQGIEVLKKEHDIDIALVDVMMPEIDGYDAIRIIRGMEEYASLPIIAVTAKAMMGDREKCIEAGASDYLAKPVRIEQLLSLLQTWVR